MHSHQDIASKFQCQFTGVRSFQCQVVGNGFDVVLFQERHHFGLVLAGLYAVTGFEKVGLYRRGQYKISFLPFVGFPFVEVELVGAKGKREDGVYLLHLQVMGRLFGDGGFLFDVGGEEGQRIVAQGEGIGREPFILDNEGIAFLEKCALLCAQGNVEHAHADQYP